jgi:hypothetical protein
MTDRPTDAVSRAMSFYAVLGLDVRYFTDFFAAKLPSKKPSQHGGNGSSDWHQDYAASASDRSGGMVIQQTPAGTADRQMRSIRQDCAFTRSWTMSAFL